MRSVTIAVAVLALAVAGDAGARQRVDGADATRPGTTFDAPPPVPTARRGGDRRPWQPQSWQRPVGARAPVAAPAAAPVAMTSDDRPSGRTAAPGDWSAYRRPYRGYALPPAWIGARFVVTDYRAYGLTPPLPGYRWVRYYDDAVLVDARGSVFDTRFDVDWDRRGERYRAAEPVVADADPGDEAPYEDARLTRRDEAEGLAPPLRERGRRYTVPVAPEYAPPPPPGYVGGGAAWRSADGLTTVTTTTGGGYAPPGYLPPGAATTTVVVQTAPAVTTTTTTEIFDEPAPVARRIVRRRVRR
ncbi:RcnB family protein [Sphingomonas sp. A2-49]|uniref:RcnB family protein n=1 Tax=Sphingomonas sp. A2-49 TaxID=1391375 RepID=UPI0021D15B81|nr:RcnB family protein [Sphingomonas sp. A2-49]MCU6455026.1 RcnB family protein [Sphingomonas sp. A2-49]